MKRSVLLVWLYLASCLGQMTFTNQFVSKTGEATLSTKSQGQLLTISTDEGFSWVISDVLTKPSENYATLICVSSGGTTSIGLAERDESGYPVSYSKGSQIMPLTGKNTAIVNDLYVFYAPSKPARGKALDFGISSIYNVGDTVHFSVSSSKIDATFNSQSTGPVSLGTYNYGWGFELLNCGTAVWCIQDASQYSTSPGDCDPGNAAPTCPVSTTCTNPQDKTDCSTASTFFIDSYSCLTQCQLAIGNTAVKTGVTACFLDCTSPCSSCFATRTTCTSCIANYYLDQDTCASPTTTTTTTTSQGFAAWKLSLAIGLPVVAVLGISMFLYIKLGAKAAQKKMTGESFKYLPSNATSPTKETIQTQV